MKYTNITRLPLWVALFAAGVVTLPGCAALPAVALLAGAASNSATTYSPTQTQNIQAVAFGRIISLQGVTITAPPAASGLGAIVGALSGGFLGSKIGQGHGSTAATVAGAVGGGVLGSHLAGNAGVTPGYQITVRLDGGQAVAVTQAADVPLSVGQRVQLLTGAGPARVLPIGSEGSTK